MALINCQECNKEYSDTAKACPHCGFTKKGGRWGCFWLFWLAIFLGIGFPAMIGALFGNQTETETSYTEEPELTESNASTSSPSVTYYLAINADVPAPENPIPVADYETMKTLIEAAERNNQAQYNSLLNSPSVSLVYGGGIVYIIDKKDGLVQVEIMGKSVHGDISGQTRWTSEKFVQFREF
ncbi:zinc ribbon domain-containing protein [Synechocystis salina LEGE 06155]|nr:zinc ribbon domain-containing protein [Synechocystis salina LEGE 06155]